MEEGREPWSSGYGRIPIFKRLWVRIAALSGYFSHILVAKLLCLFEKTKINKKEARMVILKSIMQDEIQDKTKTN